MEPTEKETAKPSNAPEKPKVVKKKGISKPIIVLLVLTLVLAAMAGTYWYRDNQAKKQQQQLQGQINQLNQQISDANKQLDAAKKADTSTTTTTPAATVPSAALVENIKAVFASGNSAALEGYMANPVSVIIAASDGIGNRTPAQATQDVTDFMMKATDPWNFDLPKSVVSDWASGSYGKYFPSNAVVGRSDDMVISFSFNSVGKISTVFMATNQDLL